MTSARVETLSRARSIWSVTTPKGVFEAPIVINAAGGWNGEPIQLLEYDNQGGPAGAADKLKAAAAEGVHIIVQGASSPGIANVKDAMDDIQKPVYINYSKDDSWWILDFSDVVVHVFKEDVRRFYDLEQLWGDASRLRSASERQAWS